MYHHTAKFLVHGVLDGFNATVFAYGNTGAGKVGWVVCTSHHLPISGGPNFLLTHFVQTYTMLGSQTDPGIMMRVMNDLFLYSEKNAASDAVIFTVTVSFLEVAPNYMVRS